MPAQNPDFSADRSYSLSKAIHIIRSLSRMQARETKRKRKKLSCPRLFCNSCALLFPPLLLHLQLLLSSLYTYIIHIISTYTTDGNLPSFLFSTVFFLLLLLLFVFNLAKAFPFSSGRITAASLQDIHPAQRLVYILCTRVHENLCCSGPSAHCTLLMAHRVLLRNVSSLYFF